MTSPALTYRRLIGIVAFGLTFAAAGSACVDLKQPWDGVSTTGGETGTWAPGSFVRSTFDAGQTGRMSGVAGGAGGGGAGGAPSSSDGTGGVGSDAGAGDSNPDASTKQNPDAASGGTGGASASGGIGGSHGTFASGGVTGSGTGKVSGGATGSGTGGLPASGSVKASGGTVAGGAVATGGKPGTGGSAGSPGTSAGCGTAKSTFSETLAFKTSVTPLATPKTTLSSATTFTSSTTGPNSNKTLCSNGCAVLSVHFSENLAANQATAAQRTFSAPVNLVGATVAFSYAIDNPAQVPIRMQVYATNAAWTWAAPTTVDGTALAAYAAATGFATESLSPVDDPDGYCASATKIVGLQVQNTAAITSATAGTVTIYVASLSISVP